jgi:hypothetical protein
MCPLGFSLLSGVNPASSPRQISLVFDRQQQKEHLDVIRREQGSYSTVGGHLS